MQTVYSNYVVREMGKAETMLKILSSSDADLSAVSALLGDQQSDTQRILALRAADGGEAGPCQSPREEDRFDGSGVAALKTTAQALQSLSDTLGRGGAKTQEDLKKLSGDMKKKLFNMTGRKGVSSAS